MMTVFNVLAIATVISAYASAYIQVDKTEKEQN